MAVAARAGAELGVRAHCGAYKDCLNAYVTFICHYDVPRDNFSTCSFLFFFTRPDQK